jgi:predicted ATP-grasp superfamily ATP-dependent carboligase
MDERADGVLIVGASTRALAQSAARAGFQVRAVDAYGDRDLVACAATIALGRDLGRPWSATAAVRVAARVRAAAVAYVSNLENHPRAVARLASSRQLWGNPPTILRQTRDPFQVAAALGQRGIPVPEVRATPAQENDGRAWLLKPRNSGGGHGIRHWKAGDNVAHSMYLQQHIDGVPGSITFVADGRRAVPLGLSLQLVGEPAFGVAAFRYCGSLLCGGPALFPREAALRQAAENLAATVTESFELVGVNGIDFIARDGTPWLVEINPRYSASMELVEREHGVSIFGLHAGACRGTLPARTPYCRHLGQVPGKAIVYAPEAGAVESNSIWEPGAVADIPHAGERIPTGKPICTVFAKGSSGTDCLETLAVQAAAVYRATTKFRQSVA